MILTFRAFLESYYIARRNVITEDSLRELRDALTRFHQIQRYWPNVANEPTA
jgi:hypothetical protein